MNRRLLSVLLLLTAHPAAASTDGPTASWALNEFGGTRAEREMLYTGTPGVLLATSPASLQFVAWRRLHGKAVPDTAGEALSIPCCDARGGPPGGVAAWLEARKTVPGAPPLGADLATERPGPDYTSIPNCLDDAFRNATATLTDRAAAHGADSPELHAWLAGQDAVFAACAKPGVALPVLPDGAPDWLRADHAYQAAALLFYEADYPGAAAAFAAIAADAASPWHAAAPYLRVRALLRRALASGGTADYAAARDAASTLSPEGPFRASGARLGGMAQLHADPAAAAARLLTALEADALDAQAAADLKDLQSLPKGDASPELLDWIATFKTGAAAPPVSPDDKGSALHRAKAGEGRRTAALAHARDRYGATHDAAWLIAALALMQPDEVGDGTLLADAASTDPASPAYLTLLYHRVRLALGTAPADTLRGALDTVLARPALPATSRNLFTAERLQLAADLGEFARLALRRTVCTKQANDCRNTDWGYYGTGGGLFDAEGDAATVGVGDDARYLIDRLPLATRMDLAVDTTLPPAIRLDVALTSFARAVLVHDDPAADRMATLLRQLLPVMAADFAAIPGAKGEGRQFALFFVFAKIPGLRADLLDYTRPIGAVTDFTSGWPDWVVLDRPDPDSIPPAPVLYDNAGYQMVDVPAGTELGDGKRRLPDVVCTGMCGAGGFVPRLPAFLAPAAVTRATAERRLLPPPGRYGDPTTTPLGRTAAFPVLGAAGLPKAVPPPAGAVVVWDFILDYVGRHPRDPRAPEALHWLIHVGHYGQSHNHSGRRAFQLLKSRYGNTSWAKQNQFYYD